MLYLLHIFSSLASIFSSKSHTHTLFLSLSLLSLSLCILLQISFHFFSFLGFLNRQLITLLSCRGIPDEYFLHLQQKHIYYLRNWTTDENQIIDRQKEAFNQLNEVTILPFLEPFYIDGISSFQLSFDPTHTLTFTLQLS